MSVLKTKRRLSTYQFWYSFIKLYEYHSNIVSQIPIRKQKWICSGINTLMRQAHKTISNVSTKYVRKPSYTNIKDELLNESITSLESLQDGLFILWNVQRFSYKSMKNWALMINNEMRLLRNEMTNPKDDIEFISVLDWDVIQKCNFLENMCKLHRFVHSKIIRVPNKYDDIISLQLKEYIDNAFTCLIKANLIKPETTDDYNKRKSLISKSIDNLHDAEFPVYELFNIMKYSESVMKQFSELITTEIRMLKGLQKSDAERFRHLH